MSEIPASGEATYAVATVVQITGIDRETIVSYCEAGLLPFAPDKLEEVAFSEEWVCLLRHVDYLRRRHGVNLSGIRMITALMAEVARLREELRFYTQ